MCLSTHTHTLTRVSAASRSAAVQIVCTQFQYFIHTHKKKFQTEMENVKKSSNKRYYRQCSTVIYSEFKAVKLTLKSCLFIFQLRFG